MNIAIDLTPIPKDKCGVGVYLYNLVKFLQKIDHKNVYYLFIQDDDLKGFNIYRENFKYVPVPSKYLRKTFLRLIWEQTILPLKLKKLKIDLLHSPHYSMPYFSSVKQVVTFHDMSFFIMPGVHTFAKRHLFRLYMWLTSKKADSIISVSHSTAEDLTKILKIKDVNSSVIALGVDERFNNSAEVDRTILKSYKIDGNYFLYVGMIEPRKNIVRLLKAYDNLPGGIKNAYKLVICGKKGWMYDDVFRYMEANNLKDKIIFTGFVKDEHLPHIYRGAKLMLYVSLYEGFGLPLVEAMVSGIPYITSNLSSMKEIAGEAGIKVDPYDENAIKEAIIQLLSDEELYDSLVEKGINRVKKYNWTDCAGKTREVYYKTLK